MIISGITHEDLESARDVASALLGNEIVFSELHSYSPKRHQVRLQVRDIDGPGARRHSHSYVMGATGKPRRSRFACRHTYGHLFAAIYVRNPLAKIQTAFAYYRDLWDFLAYYQDVLDRNIGSVMYPLRLGDECTCDSDEIPTDTLEPWMWRRGHEELPSAQNMETISC
jgi:hypothetical protein